MRHTYLGIFVTRRQIYIRSRGHSALNKSRCRSCIVNWKELKSSCAISLMRLGEVTRDLAHDASSCAVLQSTNPPECCKSFRFCVLIDTNFPKVLSFSLPFYFIEYLELGIWIVISNQHTSYFELLSADRQPQSDLFRGFPQCIFRYTAEWFSIKATMFSFQILHNLLLNIYHVISPTLRFATRTFGRTQFNINCRIHSYYLKGSLQSAFSCLCLNISIVI